MAISTCNGFQDEGTTTTPFDMVVLNKLDRFHLVMDVLDRVPRLGSGTAHVTQTIRDKLIDHTRFVDEHGIDMPEVLHWRWLAEAAGTA